MAEAVVLRLIIAAGVVGVNSKADRLPQQSLVQPSCSLNLVHVLAVLAMVEAHQSPCDAESTIAGLITSSPAAAAAGLEVINPAGGYPAQQQPQQFRALGDAS